MTDSDQTRTKVTLKDSSGTSECPEIPQKPMANVSMPLVENSPSPPRLFFQKPPPGYLAELKSSISILLKRKSALAEELKRIQIDTVRPAEIAFIRAQTQYYSSQNHTMRFEDLMNKFAETKRAACALKALCITLEKRIANEEIKRADYIKESDLIISTYDFNDVKLKAPKITEPVSTDFQGRTNQLENQRLDQRLKTAQNHIKEINNEPDYEMNSIALKEIIKATEMQSNLNMTGIKELKKEIEELTQMANQNDDLVDMKFSENSNKRRKIELNAYKQYQKEQKLAEEYQNKIKAFQEKNRKDNDKIEHLRAQLDKSRSETQIILAEIERVNNLPKPKKFEPIESENDAESNSSSTISENDDYLLTNSNQQLEFTLNQQMFQLRCQVNDLKQQYNIIKLSANDKQNYYQNQIYSMNLQYQKNLEKINQLKHKKSKNDIDDPNHMNNINNLLTKIHGSIEEISTSFFGDKL
ncbi:hypothetical protein TRFO_04414 [Tritrichomonas foetus]|uniref:Uncharacterized protein n=1 Tax=Tritrichomonas foetus TaxID=1144522 RepID=A0A1J4KJL0_9EUKA|nr:hypothetical protein TRFO_04414 [Tritrichomonas foetus]|eukprot:OHT09878.1 hypothetical protein TRFO_04414 [Tritrichomonas foetus]